MEVRYKMSVDWDGYVSACCLDYDRQLTIDHCDRDDLNTLWHNPKLRRIQSITGSGDLGKLKLCSSCELNYPFRGKPLVGEQL